MAGTDTMATATQIPSNVTETFHPDWLPKELYFHPHWIQYLETFETMPDYVYYILGIYIAIVGILGTFGNGLVIYFFLCTRALRTPPNMFIVSMAVSDMGFSAINGFPLMTISAFMRKWAFGKIACSLYAGIAGVFGFNSIGTLALISYDRYCVISNPFEAMRKVTHRRAAIQIILCWIWSCIWIIPPYFGFGRYIPEGLQIECSFDYISRDWETYLHVMSMFIFGFCVPFAAIVYSYVGIVSAVSKQAKMMQKTADKMGAKSTKAENERRQDIQLAKVAAGTISLFVISWAGYVVFAIAGINGRDDLVTPYTTQIPVMLAKTSATWNPFLYALTHPKFRAALEQKTPWLLFCKGKNMGSLDNKTKEESTKVSRMDKGGKDDDASSMTSELSADVQANPAGKTKETSLSKGHTNPAYQGDELPITKPITVSKQVVSSTTQISKAPKRPVQEDSVSMTTISNLSLSVAEQTVDVVTEEPKVPKRTSLKQRFTKSLKKASLMKRSSKTVKEETQMDNRAFVEENEDHPTGEKTKPKLVLETAQNNPGSDPDSSAEASAPVCTVDAPIAQKPEITPPDVSAPTGEIIPSSPPPPYEEFPSENNIDLNSQMLPNHESVLTTLDEFINAADSSDQIDQSSPAPDEVISMNPEGRSDISLCNDNTKFKADAELPSQDSDKLSEEQSEQTKEGSLEASPTFEREEILNSNTSNNSPNSSNTTISGDDNYTSNDTNCTDLEPLSTKNLKPEAAAEDIEIVQLPQNNSETLQTAAPIIPEPPPPVFPVPNQYVEKSTTDETCGPALPPALDFTQSILEKKDNLKPVTGPSTPVTRSKFYPATGKPLPSTENIVTEVGTKPNSNVKDLVNRFNQIPPSSSAPSSENSSTDLGFDNSAVENEIKSLAASLFTNQFSSEKTTVPLNSQLQIPEISVRNLTQMFDSSDSSLATTPIISRKGSNVSVGYYPMNNSKYKTNEDGLHPYWSASSSSSSDSDSDSSEISFVPSRRSSDIRRFSDSGSDLSNDTDVDVVRFAGEIAGDVVNNVITMHFEDHVNAKNSDNESFPSPPPSPILSDLSLDSHTQGNDLSVDTVDFPAPPLLAHEDVVESHHTPTQNESADSRTSLALEEQVTSANVVETNGDAEKPLDQVSQDDTQNTKDQPEGDQVKKLERGKRSTIRRKLTEEEIKKGDSIKEKKDPTDIDLATPQNESLTKLTRKRGSTLKRKVPLNKSLSKASIASRTSVTSRSSQISEVGPDGIHYKPGFV